MHKPFAGQSAEKMVRLITPPKVVQHGLDMIGLRDNVLPIVGVLVEFSGYTCRPQVI